MTLIAAENVSVALGPQPVLQGVSLALHPAEIVTIVGPNGSGKSTLLRTLLGIVPVQAGRVTRAPGLRLGYVPQKLALDPTLPLPVARFLSLPRRHPATEIAAVLDRVGLPGVERRPLSGLSGGQMQRVLLARVLLGRPQAILMDEPTQGLDQPGEAAFYRLLEEVRSETGAAVLMVSHDLHVVMAASDRVVCLNGHVCCEGTPRVVSDAPEYRALFGEGTRGALALYRHHHDHHHHDRQDPPPFRDREDRDQDCDRHDHDHHGHGHHGHDARTHGDHGQDQHGHDAHGDHGRGRRGHRGCDHA